MDRVKTMAYPGSYPETLTYAYWPNGAVNSVNSSLLALYVGETRYNEAGMIDTMCLGNVCNGAEVVRVTYEYYDWQPNPPSSGEARRRLASIQAGPPGQATALLNLSYADYDLAGNVLQIQDFKMGSPQVQTFTYDERNRLLSAVASGGTYGDYGPMTLSAT
jgi:hypothetical protein